MNDLFRVLGKALCQTAQWSARHPRATRVVARGLGLWYRSLRPSEKRKVHAILQAGAVKLARLAVGDVVHWAAREAIAQGLDRTAVTVIESSVERVAEVGIDCTLHELQRR